MASDIRQLRAHAGIRALLSYYDKKTGLFATTGWWNSANCVTVLANFALLSSACNVEILDVFANTFQQAQLPPTGFPSFLNDFYDDEGWWALAWLNVYDLTGAPKYLQMAATLFNDMAMGWGGTCGGLRWNKKQNNTDAIENELFMAVAAQLANRTDEPNFFTDWAVKQWSWFKGTEMINADYNVNNGIDGSTCKNDGGVIWTYNQGVVLGAFVELNLAKPDPSLLETAEQIALAAIKRMTDAQGILHDPGEPELGADGPQFKGIFMRNLQILNAVRPRKEFQEFIDNNAESIWVNRMDGDRFGVVWSSLTTTATAATQSSACDALVAALNLSNV